MSTPSTSDSSHERCLAVVTGSTSGIGKAIAVDLARRGFTVVVNGRSQASVDSAVANVKAASEAPLVLGAVGDLGTEAGCTNFITDVEALSKQHALPINVLVNNMGIFETADFFSVPDSTWQHYIDVNFFSGLRLSRHWLKDMLARGASGRVLFIASETGVRIVPDMLHYSITKQMQIGLSRGLAQLTKGSRVTVNTILPGPTWTEGVEVYIQGLAKQTGVSVEDATTNYFKQREPTSLLQRFIQPAEVAAAAAFLVSEGGAAVNGAAVLREDDEFEGIMLDEVQEEGLLERSEAEIRAFFRSRGQQHAATARGGDRAPSPSTAATDDLAALQRAWPPPGADDVRRWFPALRSHQKLSNAHTIVLAFPNSGSGEDMYSSEGTGARRAPSPLLDWCRTSGAVLTAVQPPGRGLRAREPPLPDLAALAAALLPVAAPALLAAGRYYVVGHSVGAWAAYEFLQLARSRGLPMPAGAFLSAMPAPDIPEEERPWRRQALLTDEEFKDECRQWDINEVVFSPDLWPTFEPLLRADFRLFDEYCHRHPTPAAAPPSLGWSGPGAAGAPPFAFPVTAFWGDEDRRIGERMVQGWARFTRGPFAVVRLRGANHLWPGNNRAAKREWLERIVAGMQGTGLDL